MTEDLKHYGTPRKSGRYPWGSGQNPAQRNSDFLARMDILKKQGMSPTKIAEEMGITTTELRARNSIAVSERRKALEHDVLKLKEKGMSNVAIAKQLGLKNESTVRSLLNPATSARNEVLKATADALRERVGTNNLIEVGAGNELYMGISPEKFNTALAMLKEEGYEVHKYSEEQMGNAGKFTTMRVLAPPGTGYAEVLRRRDEIQGVKMFSEDHGRTFLGIAPPVQISSKRVAIRYGDQGGDQQDGLIELRRTPDLDLGTKRYAQVRIAVDGTHYIKGMAIHTDDLPAGVDILVNTPKLSTGNKLDVLKPLQKDKNTGAIDEDMPFGAVVSQRYYTDKDGKRKLSAINRVGSPNKEGAGEEGAWGEWSRTLSSQVLSKQKPELAKRQLELAYDAKKAAYDEIMAINNPAVKKRLLDSFADSCDSSAVTLKAHAMPRQRIQVIIPVPNMKDNEVYAPNFNNGEHVVLIRYPHGGTFEIPELIVNNRNPQGKARLGDSEDAIGINHNVAGRLSGADFDGDTVLVIPNDQQRITTSPPLWKPGDFDPQTAYPRYDGMKILEGKAKQKKMGEVSNLITDMTIKGAPLHEISRAVKHSMVVIDAEKHKLNHKLSYQENGIASLRAKYQQNAGGRGGASTLISRASADIRVPRRKARPSSEGGPIDPVTGAKVWKPTGETYTKTIVSKKGTVREEVVVKTFKSKKMAETDNAYTLTSGPGLTAGTRIEGLYADHANALKSLGNQSRLSSLKTPNLVYSPSAAKTYVKEVTALNAKLAIAQRNAPLERLAQTRAASIVRAKKNANPNMEPEELKKIKGLALLQARNDIGAKKISIDITPEEWNAIQAGAITHHKLTEILKNTNLDLVKQYATPREVYTVTPAKLAKAKNMQTNGYTQAEIAEALGVPVSTLNKALR